MHTLVRWSLVGVASIHGLIHLLGVVKGFGWAEVEQLEEPISMRMGGAWLLATVAMLTAAGLVAFEHRWWRPAIMVAAIISQAVIVTSWSDAKAGTVANVLLVIAAVWPGVDR